MWTHIRSIAAELRRRARFLRDEPEAGYSTETVLVTALLVIGALVVVGILVAKITAKANDIDLSWLAIVVPSPWKPS